MKKIIIFVGIALGICLLTVFAFAGGKTIKVDVADGTIYGELHKCSNDVIVVFVAGSGPTDKNGNTSLIQGRNDSFLQLANELKNNGISTFRYDKRSAGKSAEFFDNTKQIEFDDFVDDLNACIEELRGNEFESIIIAGHSQGSLLGMLSAENADGYISIAGSGYPINETMIKQYCADESTFEKEIGMIYMFEKGIINEAYAKENKTFSINNQKFILSWMKYDPREEIAKITCPFMLIQGDNDLQVTVDDMETLQKANPKAECYIVKDMNHVLKRVANDCENEKSYLDPSFAIHDELVDLIVEFAERYK